MELGHEATNIRARMAATQADLTSIHVILAEMEPAHPTPQPTLPDLSQPLYTIVQELQQTRHIPTQKTSPPRNLPMATTDQRHHACHSQAHSTIAVTGFLCPSCRPTGSPPVPPDQHD
ncbi:hypothetical protein HDU97_010306 [Phlyctochytrium planicorne]|nr:hypothetical protein HDU97_010306 [Phlyctochytrium planicorne]